MPRTRRPSPQTSSVLRALVARAGRVALWLRARPGGRPQGGLALPDPHPPDRARAARGALGGALRQSPPGGRPRHLYRLTGAGRELASRLAPATPRLGAAAAPGARCGQRRERARARPRRSLPRRSSSGCCRRAARDWGRAMRAELATLEQPGRTPALRARLHARGAAPERQARGPPGVRWPSWAPSALVLAGEVALARAIGRSSPLVLALALLAWLGRRPSYFGPVRADRATRAARCGRLLRSSAACLIALVVAEGVPGLLRPDSLRWGTTFALVLTLVAAAFLAMTARATRLGGAAWPAASAQGSSRARRGSSCCRSSASGRRSRMASPATGRGWRCSPFGGSRRGRARDRTARPAARIRPSWRRSARAPSAALLVALLGLSAIVFLPDRVPDIVGPVHACRVRRRPQRQLENSIEASDPYFGLLVFGALLAAVLWVMARPPDARRDDRRARARCWACRPSSSPASARDFPGATGSRPPPLAVVIGAVATARPARPA